MSDYPFQADIERAARQHGLPLALVRAVVEIESSYDPWAARYEDGFFRAYLVGKVTVGGNGACSAATELRLRACSFGLMQVMGQTARELGFAGMFLTELCDVGVGLEYGARYLARQAKRYRERYGWEGVAASYNAGRVQTNGPSFVNQGYVDKIRRAGGFS